MAGSCLGLTMYSARMWKERAKVLDGCFINESLSVAVNSHVSDT